MDPSTGVERVLHSFGKIGDGASPWTALTNVNGTLYGTTDLGGSLGLCGTVFSIQTDGSNEQIVHNFKNNPTDGCDPFAPLLLVKNTLYGTTCCGGGYYCPHCEGVLYSVDVASGKEQVLHNFGSGYGGSNPDGSQPVSPVINVHGVLYGTADIGGTGTCIAQLGCGTIFSYALSSSHAYTTLYDFSGTTDGGDPRAGLLYSNKTFFGMTTFGGKKGRGTGIKLRAQ